MPNRFAPRGARPSCTPAWARPALLVLLLLLPMLLGVQCVKSDDDDSGADDDDSGADDDDLAVDDDDTAMDEDGDGWLTPFDCDDGNADIHPEAEEVCNGKDDDCDESIDEDLPTQTYYEDADEDGFGNPDRPLVDCGDVVEGYSLANTDCDDSSPSIYPGAPDVGGDGVDSDCDGLDCHTATLDGARFGVCFGEFVWPDARALCTGSFGGDMASIRSAAEQQFVRELMVGANMPYVLIGLTDEANEGVFIWVDASTLGYTNWGVGEPNNGGGGGGNERTGENCAAIQGDQDYIWNDVPCDVVTNSAVLCGSR